MKLFHTKDTELLKRIATDKEMWPKICPDQMEAKDYEPTIPADMVMLGAKVGDEIIGLSLLSVKPEGLVYHPMIIKKYRREHGREFIKASLAWVFESTSFENIFVKIPVDRVQTINFASHFDFKEVGIEEKGIIRDGKMIDLKIMRLDKGDMSWAA